MAKSTAQTGNAASEDFLRFLVAQGLLDEERAQRVREESARAKQLPEWMVVQQGLLSEEDASHARAAFLKVPFRELPEDFEVPKDLSRIIPEEAVQRYQFIPLKREGGVLEVGMVSPDDLVAQNALRFLLAREGLREDIFLIAPSAFRRALRQYRPFRGEVEQAIGELQETLTEGSPAAQAQPLPRGGEVFEEAPIIKMVAVIFRQAVEGGASDVHIEPGLHQMRVRFRVDGILYTSLFLPMSAHAAVASRLKILATLKIDETRLAQDGRFRSVIDGKSIDFRVATFPTSLGEKVAIRILDPSVGLRSLSDLGLVGHTQRIVEEAIRKPFGMILITGPTGSGKTTTQYGILQEFNRDEQNIVTLEDPIEYFIEGVNQSQINDEIGYSFSTGLRHVLRGDPDIIMVGEIRDSDTAKLAVHAGLTGHLVLSTLHTNNAIGVIPRLIDLGVDAFLVAPTLTLAVAQRLVQRLCDACKTSRDPLPQEREVIASALVQTPEKERASFPKEKEWKIWEAKGCDRCRGRGTIGRIAVFEALKMTRELEEIILEAPSEARIAKEAERQGMVTMFQDGIRKALDGRVALREVLRVVEEQQAGPPQT